jgi:flagellar assembly factor FliW
MKIDSSRFGPIEIPEEKVITLPQGLIGLPGTKYALVTRDEKSPFVWLHSVEDGGLALPVTNPWLFFPDYEVRISDEDAESIGLEGPEQADILCVVRATEEIGDFTVNLLSPIVLHAAKRTGKQVINEVAYDVRAPLFAEVGIAQAGATEPQAPVIAA